MFVEIPKTDVERDSHIVATPVLTYLTRGGVPDRTQSGQRGGEAARCSSAGQSVGQRRMFAVPVGGGLPGVPGAHEHLFLQMAPNELKRERRPVW